MKTKLFEVFDRHSVFCVMATAYAGSTPKEDWLLVKAGLGPSSAYQVMLTDLESGETQRDPYRWGDRFTSLHQYIAAHFDTLASGAVLDLEVIRQEKDTPRESLYTQSLSLSCGDPQGAQVPEHVRRIYEGGVDYPAVQR